MTPPRAWLAALVEQALAEYLADNGSAHSSPSSGLFLYEQTLSNLRVTPVPSLLDTVHLVDTRDQRKEVKAVIGDLEHTVRATFTKAALDGAAITTSGVPFQRLQVGTVFKILECEIRFSDCFNPARINIRITSVAVISPGAGLALFANLKKVEEEPSVMLNLEEYSLRRSDSMDSDSDNDELMASQEDFMTQVPYKSLKPPSPYKHNLERPVSPVILLARARNQEARLLGKPATNASSKEGLKARSQQSWTTPVEETAPTTAHFVAHVPMQVEKRANSGERESANTVKATKPEHVRRSPVESNLKSPAVDQNTTGKGGCEGGCEGKLRRSSIGAQSLWQKRAVGGRYVPRYAGTRARDQQELVENNASWQPSLVGQRPIEGQVPLQLLERLSRAADAAAESKDREIDNEASSEHKEVDPTDRGTCNTISVESQPADSALHQSPSPASSQTTWDETPPHPAQIRPCLPPDSSPLKGIEETAPNDTANRQYSNPVESTRSSIQANQEIPSSPFSEMIGSDDEDDHFASPVQQEAPALAATQTTILDIGSDSDDQPGQVTPSIGLPEPEVREVEERTFIVDGHVQNISNESDVRGATSSLGSMRKVQIWRTPAVQRRNSDTTNAQPDRRTEKNSKQDYRSLPQINLAQSFPPNSQFVPGTYLPQPPKEAISESKALASKAEPPSEQRPLRLLFGEEADRPQFEDPKNERRRESSVNEMSSKQQEDESTSLASKKTPAPEPGMIAPWMIAKVCEEADQPQVEEPCNKRKHESSICEKSFKRQKNKAVRGKPVPTGTDPDLFPVEIEIKQYRRDIIEEQTEEHNKLARIQQSHAATLLNDENSVESRGRPPSPRSSVLSTSKRHILTPITRSSDYQFSNAGKDHLDRSPSGDLSVSQNTAQDTFKLFVSTYPNYKGGRTQFEQACQLLQELGESGPRPYLRDDFVFRYNNDYMDDYHFRITKAGKLPMPFELFYREREQDSSYEPISVAKVLKHAQLSSGMNGSSLLEGPPSVNAHPFGAVQFSGSWPLSIASNFEPQLLPLPARSEGNAVTKTGSPKSKSQPQLINHSQDLSVKIWLEKASGEESPELGTPSLPKADVEVPPLDLKVTGSNPAPATKSKARTLPWQKQDEPSTSAVHAATTSASVPKPRDEKGKSKVLRRHTDFPITKEADTIDFTKPPIFHKPHPNGQIAFEELAEHYYELDERRGIPRAPAHKVVDIFGWKR